MAIPDNTRRLLQRRLRQRAQERWPDLADVAVRYRGSHAYVDGVTHEGENLPLCRLRYLGSASNWGFAAYLATKGGYETSVLPDGRFSGSPEQALDCVCGLYLEDPTAWR